MLSLDGKVAVITGATSGIGARTAELFAESGARVVIAGRRAEKGEALAKAIGDRASFIRTDVCVESEVKAMIDHALRKFGRIDCLFNNAGTLPTGAALADIDLAEFDEGIAVHVKSVLAGMKHVAPVMRAQKSGSIVNMASIVALRAGLGSIAYSTAKAAVIHMTKCAAIELGEDGIRVNSVSPGRMVTGIFGKAVGLANDVADARADGVRAALEKILPHEQALPGIGTADNVARAVLFLASDDSSFVNGHDLVIDGGVTAGNPARVMNEQISIFVKTLQSLASH